MTKIVLISCVSKKESHLSKAEDLYKSPLFRYSLKYARNLNPYKIYILSAKHGLLTLNYKIKPYNETLNEMKLEQIKRWSLDVLKKLKKETDLQNDEFIFLAGEKYRKYLIPHIVHHIIPMKGLSIGKQLKFLKDKIKNESDMQ